MNILTKALSARAALGIIKTKLEAESVDVSDIRYITDLPGVLSRVLPQELAEKAADILEDEESLSALLEAFSKAAEKGGLVHMICAPTDMVFDTDLTAKGGNLRA